MTTLTLADVHALHEKVRTERPLVHNITNFVAMNVAANVLLAAGASPAMVHSMDEVVDTVMGGVKGAVEWVMGLIDTAKHKVMGFIDSVAGAIGKVGQLLGLTNDASDVDVKVSRSAQAVGQSPAMQEMPAKQPMPAQAVPTLQQPGGVIGRAGNTTTNTSTVTQTTTITAPITINSPDPAKAGESVRQELGRLNKQAVRNGQTAVAL